MYSKQVGNYVLFTLTIYIYLILGIVEEEEEAEVVEELLFKAALPFT